MRFVFPEGFEPPFKTYIQAPLHEQFRARHTESMIYLQASEPEVIPLTAVYSACTKFRRKMVRNVGFEPTHVETYRVLNPTP